MERIKIDKTDFDKSIKSTIKTISNKKKLLFYFKKNLIKIDDNKIYLPEISSIKNRIDLKNYRGIADYVALKLKFHNKKIYYKFKPKEDLYLEFYDALEETRIISLGFLLMEGISANLKSRLAFFCKKNHFNEIKKRNNSQIIQVIKLIVLQYFNHKNIPKFTLRFVNLWKPIVLLEILENLEVLKKNLNNQRDYAIESLKLIKKLKKFLKINNENLKEGKQKKDIKEKKNKDQKKYNKNVFLNEFNEEENYIVNKKNKKKLLIKAKDKNKKEIKFLKKNNFRTITENLKYKIYTNKFDKIIKAEKFSNINELKNLNKILEKDDFDSENTIKKLAKKLQNKLLAKNFSFWKYEEEEGKLNNKKLSKIISNNNYKKIYKKFEKKEIKSTVITLLIDNSGSMRGRPIKTAALCSKIISQTLERCSVKVEILGFTTNEWKGGKSREEWISNNMPDNPGRLNDLMHIIYKTPENSIKKIKNNFALMLKDGLLKENIDGESLLWALNRILDRSEERKILMIISDGAPVDDSTISSNKPRFLENHLKKVINLIENKTNVEIVAIGIGHDVSKYYKKAVKINDPDQLGGVMIEKFSELFKVNK